MKTLKNTILCITAIASASFAQAITINVSPDGALAGMAYATFDSLALGNSAGSDNGVNLTFSGTAQAVIGSLSGKYAAPYVSADNGNFFGNPAGKDTTTYLSTGIGAVTLNFSGIQNYLGLLWGSIDTYNSLSFYNGANLIATYTGTDVVNSPNGDQGINGAAYVNITTDSGFDRVVASATNYAFEFDNVAFGRISVPDTSSTLALLGLGLAGAFVLRRKLRR